ncbi:hypothetical protein D9756_000925 [Leucocoprinus leucothites]|uniref:DUF6534 domain-containing protein n=1 Tax=Leucocoprinus leucothites TaxID=201217 RepID=A0A8H5GFX0_9AGAR|nr:hypothetical protein D9756_000925 [Leucoagaricus leucothites]
MSEILPSDFPTREITGEITAYIDPNEIFKIKHAALFGYCFDILLYGFLTVQVYVYYLAFSKDKKLTEATVYLVYTIGSIQTAFALRDFHELFCIPGLTLRLVQVVHTKQVTLVSDISDLHAFGFMWLTIPVSSALVAVTVQLFYAQRIWIVSHLKSITLIVALLALAQLGCGIFSAIIVYRLLPPLPPEISPSSVLMEITIFNGRIVNGLVWGCIGGLCDLVIAVFMFVYISKQTKGTSRTTQKSLLQIKRLFLETGLLTVIAAVSYIMLSTFTSPTPTSYMVPGLLLSKLYSNSMLAVLNNRLLIDKGRYASHTTGVSFYEPSVATGT